MESQDDQFASLLPRLAQLNAVVNRGRVYERATTEAGVSLERPAMGALVLIALADRPLRIGEIATRMQVAGPHATRQVQALEQRGLVHRIADPLDQRVRLIEPTAGGREVSERYTRSVFGWFAEAMTDWSQEDRQDLVRLLGRAVDDLTAKLADEDRPG
ncbi:MarR family winged helix-turn-helix transcriptional regulator [Umezawaea beigongshangensis]|uniref:MarR family winged helix-turn-helix transcriptional regulator n=1 Tax=Umezawaea beigongshangensis TaxID=2780383 RepID=UPI0018F25E51|nr:MarR family transcriptional regulator [Umezawaea beigongshangensis]